MGNNYYNNSYFNSAIFDYDYVPVAEAIVNAYTPSTVIEFGCGNGELSKALSRMSIKVTAIDGYATPDFAGHPNIEFYKLDLNNAAEIKKFLVSLNKTFDVAVCMEVAEHLDPEVSSGLIECMTAAANVVIFSAAVPQQDGDGHINCRSRLFWHREFERNNFFLRDTIRSQIRNNLKVGRWYALNSVDYVKLETPPSINDYSTLVANLVESESEASSHFYFANRKVEYQTKVLHKDVVRWAFNFRNFIKKIIGRPTLPDQ